MPSIVDQRERAAVAASSPPAPPSSRSRHRSLFVAVLALVAAGAMFFLGTGLHPVPVLTWLAPLPCLLLGPRVSARTAVAVAGGAFLIGELSMLRYMFELEVPIGLVAGLYLLLAAFFAGAVALARMLTLAGRPAWGAVAAGSAWAAGDHLLALLSPHGAFSSLAYTQADVLPVVQITSLTGIWGISFLLVWFPAAVAGLVAPGIRIGSRLRGVVVLVLVVGTVLGYGWWRWSDPPVAGSDQIVALVASDTDDELVPPDSPAGQALIRRYASAVAEQVTAGADVVVLPEKVFLVDDDRIADQLQPLATAVSQTGAVVVVGTGLREGELIYNAAVALGPAGQDPTVYRKHHLIPGLEADLTPGEGLSVVQHDSERWGLAVCKDLDFPRLIRQYGAERIDLLLVPGWDFTDDAWLHSRMAVVRGVENGFAVGRSARDGVLTVSDHRGKVLVETPSRSGPNPSAVRTSVATSSGGTLYARAGDWFGWASLVAVLIMLAFGRGRAAGRQRRRSVDDVPGSA